MPSSHHSAPMWELAATALIETARELGHRSGAATAGQRTALTTLHCLAAFAEQQVQLFGNGFAPGGALTPDPVLTIDFLRETLVRQLTFDIDVLQRALAQRTEACSTPAMRAQLS